MYKSYEKNYAEFWNRDCGKYFTYDTMDDVMETVHLNGMWKICDETHLKLIDSVSKHEQDNFYYVLPNQDFN